MENRSIYLIGFMGAGKTTVGIQLAKQLNKTFIDMDDQIEKKTGSTISEIFSKKGEQAFRKLEHEYLKNHPFSNHIISTGGGIVLKKENRHILKQMPFVIYLDANPSTVVGRIINDEINIRPVIAEKSKKEIEEIYLHRIPLYKESANIIVNTDKLTPNEVVSCILNEIKKVDEM